MLCSKNAYSRWVFCLCLLCLSAKTAAQDIKITHGSCASRLTSSETGGSLKYPISGNYDSGAGCSWLIGSEDSTKFIQLTLLRKDIDLGGDFLTIFTTKGTPLYAFSGQSLSASDTVTLPYNQLVLYFSSNGYYQYTGFQLQYTFVSGKADIQPDCPSVLSTTAAGGSLKYPTKGKYKKGAGCSWTIGTPDTSMSIQLTMLKKDINAGHDFLSIYTLDGVPLYRFTGQGASASDTVTLPYNQLVLFFTSDAFAQSTGFQLEYTYVSEKKFLQPDCPSTFSANATGGQIKSPIKGNYKSGIGCSWLISTPDTSMSIQLALRFKDLNEGWDFLSIYTVNGVQLHRFTGQQASSSDTVIFPYNQLVLYVTSSIEAVSTGFQLDYTFVSGKTSLQSDCPSVSSTNAAGGSLKYPMDGKYKRGDGCSWIIGTKDASMFIQLSLLFKDIETRYDFLAVYTIDGAPLYRFAGQTISESDIATFPYNQLVLYFTSDYSTELTGFQLEYTYVPGISSTPISTSPVTTTATTTTTTKASASTTRTVIGGAVSTTPFRTTLASGFPLSSTTIKSTARVSLGGSVSTTRFPTTLTSRFSSSGAAVSSTARGAVSTTPFRTTLASGFPSSSTTIKSTARVLLGGPVSTTTSRAAWTSTLPRN